MLRTFATIAICTGIASAQAAETRSNKSGAGIQMAQSGRTCRTVSSCREAVILWCGGYSRADADSDGIPCENVCRSLAQVAAIKSEIDC